MVLIRSFLKGSVGWYQSALDVSTRLTMNAYFVHRGTSEDEASREPAVYSSSLISSKCPNYGFRKIQYHGAMLPACNVAHGRMRLIL